MILNNINFKEYFTIILIAALIYNIYAYPKNKKIISTILLVVIFISIKNGNFIALTNTTESKLKTDVVNKILNNIKDYTIDITYDDIYPINKVPKRFMFVKKNIYLTQIIFDLKFLERYNKDGFYKIIVLLEYFLKYYYKTITDEYDYKTVIPMLLAIRSKILNLLTEQAFSVPIEMNLPLLRYDIPNTDEYINLIKRKIQAYTYKKIEILSNKNKNKTNTNIYKSPKEYNVFLSKYEVF